MWFWLFWATMLIVVFLIAYVRWLIKQVEQINETLSQNNQMISDFSDHLSSLYEMEMFYGDETLKGLLEHAKLIVEEVKSADLLLVDLEKESALDAKKD